MSTEQSCKDHPNVKAIANCERCETPLCGMCSQFTDSGTPNIITVDGDNIRVSHPNPEFFGYSELFVSSNNPTPILLPQE